MYLRPEKIYIHTDIREDLIEVAFKDSSDRFVQALSTILNIEVVYHASRNAKSSGMPIPKLPNRSDFVRTDVLVKYGGIFLDSDAYVLRDLSRSGTQASQPFWRANMAG